MRELICPKCGKNFIPAALHIYHDEKNYYCSWTCYNHRNDHKKNKRKQIELYNESGEFLLRRFKSAEEAAIHTGYNASKIRDACRKQTIYYGYLWRYKNDLS